MPSVAAISSSASMPPISSARTSSLQLDQHVAFAVRIDELPDDLATGRRQRFDQRRDFRRMQAVDEPMPMAQRALLERAA